MRVSLHLLVLLVLAVFSACALSAPSNRDAVPTLQEGATDMSPTTPAAETQRVVVHVAARDDALGALTSEYLRLLHTQEEPAILEATFAPGTYEDLHLNLTDAMRKGRIHLVLRGEAGEPPPTFLRSTFSLEAESVNVSGLVFRDSGVGVPALRVSVGRSARLEGLAFVDLRVTRRGGGPLVRIDGMRDRGSKEARVADCWFLGNREASPSALVQFDATAPELFSRVEFVHNVMAGNTFDTLLSTLGVEALDLNENHVLVEPAGRLLDLKATRLAGAGNRVWLPTGARFATRAAPAIEATLEDTELRVPGNTLDADAGVRGVRVLEAAAPSPASLMVAWRARALAGRAPETATLDAEWRGAFGSP